MRKNILFIFLLVNVLACKNLDSVSPTKTASFTYFYGGSGNYQAKALVASTDGYLIVGNDISIPQTSILAIKTDLTGKTLWSMKIPNASAAAVISTTNGYLICGDSIKIDLSQTSVLNQTRTKMRLISISSTDGTVSQDQSFGDDFTKVSVDSTKRKDFHGTAVSSYNDTAYVATFNIDFPNSSPHINTFTGFAIHKKGTLVRDIFYSYTLDQQFNFQYQNPRSLEINYAGNFFWPASCISGNASNANSFIRMVAMTTGGGFTNGSTLGANDNPAAYYSSSDIKSNAVGYGIIGTYENSSLFGANVFFLRSDLQGNLDSLNAKFFDGPTCSKSKTSLPDKTQSSVEDHGTSITATSDGGFLLAGYTTTSADGTWGHGGLDVYLIRLLADGTFVWSQTIGGLGDEIPSGVVQTADGGFVICGTLLLAGQSSMFLTKVNAAGEIKN